VNIDSHYDVAIVGAGPCGATAARYAAESASVLVIEEKKVIGVPVQCAGFLPKYGELAKLMPDSDLPDTFCYPDSCVYREAKYQRFIAPTIESGDNVWSIEVRLTGNEVGTHEIESEVYYQFRGSPKSPTRYDMLTLIVEQDTRPTDSESEAREIVVPGFGAMVAIIGLLAAYLRRIRI